MPIRGVYAVHDAYIFELDKYPSLRLVINWISRYSAGINRRSFVDWVLIHDESEEDTDHRVQRMLERMWNTKYKTPKRGDIPWLIRSSPRAG